MLIALQFDPSLNASFITNPPPPYLAKLSVSQTITSGTLVIKNRSLFDLSFIAGDHSTFYVEQQTARAFYFGEMYTWDLFYTPINKSGLWPSSNSWLPYQQCTIEFYYEQEHIIEQYPQSYPLFALPPLEIISRGSQLFYVSTGVKTSPVTGNIPFALWWQGSGTKVATILSLQISLSAATEVQFKAAGASNPNFTSSLSPVCSDETNQISAVMLPSTQNTSVATVPGSSYTDMFCPVGITDLIAPGVITLQSSNVIGAALSGGIIAYLEPTAATTYAWSALWKEELN